MIILTNVLYYLSLSILGITYNMIKSDIQFRAYLDKTAIHYRTETSLLITDNCTYSFFTKMSPSNESFCNVWSWFPCRSLKQFVQWLEYQHLLKLQKLRRIILKIHIAYSVASIRRTIFMKISSIQFFDKHNHDISKWSSEDNYVCSLVVTETWSSYIVS